MSNAALSVLALGALLGLIPATVASRKGGDFWLWWIGGTALFIAAMPLALVKRDKRKRACPYCLESVWLNASVCPHCQRELTA